MSARFTSAKDATIVTLDGLLRLSRHLPEWVPRATTAGLGLFCKAWYVVAGGYVRNTTSDLCRVIGCPYPRRIYFKLVDNTVQAARMYGAVMRRDAGAVIARTDFDPAGLTACRQVMQRYGGAVFVAPHCIGSILSGARFSKEFPAVELAREAESGRRARIAGLYMDKLGMEPLFVRHADPVNVARSVCRALHANKFVIGTTDLPRHAKDTVEAEFFGQKIWLPRWPARFAARCRKPIVPMYLRMTKDRILITIDEPYLEQDIAVATQRWASCFERNIRAYPADWIFMFDKHWSRILAGAATEATQTRAVHAC
jgi:KDO2-lipid IV(A) lauroyltransferase